MGHPSCHDDKHYGDPILQIKSARMLLSDEAWATKATGPAILIVSYLWMVMSAATLTVFIHRVVAFLPLLAMALWGIFIPFEVEAKKGEDFITLINWGHSIRIPLEDVEYIDRRISIFDTLKIKSGRKFLYITCRENKHLLLAENGG